LLKDFELAALDLLKIVSASVSNGPFIIYGHSMGALLAFRLTHLLAAQGRFPKGLIVSGNAGPGIPDADCKKRYLLGKKEFVEELRSIGGVPEELLQNDELLDFFEPILRADFEVSEENGMNDETPVNIPVFALMGSEEEENKHIQNWAKYTRSFFDCTILDGGHFFIHKHPQRIAGIISDFNKKCLNV
jgi:external thioesterase TEII